MSTPGSILVVDDMSANVTLLEELLSNKGYVVRTASSGEQAVHGPHGAQILVFVEQSGADLDGRMVLKSGAVQMSQHGVAFGLRQTAGGPLAGRSWAEQRPLESIEGGPRQPECGAGGCYADCFCQCRRGLH